MPDTGIVVFDYAAWALMFPTLAASIDEPTAQAYFDSATLFLDNTGCSQVVSLTKRALILNYLTAHVAALFGTIGGNPPSPLVGKISQATEGSVSVSVDWPTTANNAWWLQTPYGAFAWQALAPYRTALYIAAPQIPLAAQSWPGGAFGYSGLPFTGYFPFRR